MGKNDKTIKLNIGCGLDRLDGYINVDAYGAPDYKWDLNEIPYPWDDNSIDEILAKHVFEHLDDWWIAFKECSRILKPGGKLEIRVPDESSRTALTYRDHYHVFSLVSFHGIQGADHGTNSWAKTEKDSILLVMENYYQVPHPQYQWMIKWCPRILKFCAEHLRNFIHEQRFTFRKVGT